MDTKEEVRERVDIVELIGEYVELKRSGRSYKGLSPFKAEKTPSFMVSPDKQIWYDFSSNQGGDIFSFIMKVEGMEFRPALEFLAKKVDVEITTNADAGNSEKKKRLQAANTAAMHYFQKQLVENKSALEYLRSSRGLTKQIIVDFNLGYAPDSYNDLPKYLQEQGFSDDEIIDGGLGRRGKTGLYSLFRHRIMVPLKDRSGGCIGFTGRLLDGESDGPKYLNTPQTLIYDKGRHVFGLDAAKDTILKEEFSVVVEGNFDVISSHMVGVNNCVATAGTAMTLSQIKTLSKLGPTIKIAYDNDSAGFAATERAVVLAAGEVDLQVVTIEDAKDADELIARDPQAWVSAIESAGDAFEWVVDSYINSGATDSARGKHQLSGKLAELLRPIKDPVVREHYVNYVAEHTAIGSDALNQKINITESSRRRRRVKADPDETPPETPAYADNLDKLVTALVAGARPAKGVIDPLLDIMNEDQRLIASGSPLNNPSEYAKIMQFKAEQRYEGWNEDQLTREATAIVNIIKKQNTRTQRTALTAELAQAEADGDTAKINEILQQIQSIK